MIIRDPSLITKHNPHGQRTITQADIDHLQRVSAAFAHVTPYLVAVAPSLIQDAQQIIAGLATDPPMTDDGMRAYMDAEDATMPQTLADPFAVGLTFLDFEGNVIVLP